MHNNIIARNEEIKTLKRFVESRRPEFLALYGRRRIGKTFLIKEFFKNKKVVFFKVTGLKKGSMKEQIKHFTTVLSESFYHGVELNPKNNWDDTFDLLTKSIQKIKGKIVLFFDEFPWMATPKSKLLESLDYYWNQYWSTDSRIKLIVCGSSASWIINNIINNQGGLHNRLTYDIYLEPFNLAETKQFLEKNAVKLNNKHLIDLYMSLGGVPHYLDKIEAGLSSTQVIEKLAFKRKSFLMREFDNLFSSLFKNPDVYIEILRKIAACRYGIGQNDLLKSLGSALAGKGGLQKLKALEETGFIISFKPIFHKEKGIHYRVIDHYTLFYLSWIEPIKLTLMKKSLLSGYWDKVKQRSSWVSWAGLTFEAICFEHLPQITRALKLNATAIPGSWRYIPRKNSGECGAQIDLLFDRDDDAITICEIKYSQKPFVITKEYAEKLKQKIAVFKKTTRTKKQLFMVMISANGVKDNKYSKEIVGQVITLDDLFYMC